MDAAKEVLFLIAFKRSSVCGNITNMQAPYHAIKPEATEGPHACVMWDFTIIKTEQTIEQVY